MRFSCNYCLLFVCLFVSGSSSVIISFSLIRFSTTWYSESTREKAGITVILPYKVYEYSVTHLNSALVIQNPDNSDKEYFGPSVNSKCIPVSVISDLVYFLWFDSLFESSTHPWLFPREQSNFRIPPILFWSRINTHDKADRKTFFVGIIRSCE